MAQKDTINAHGREAGRHKHMYQQARQKIMEEISYNESFMADVNNLAIKEKMNEKAKAKSSEQFLA